MEFLILGPLEVRDGEETVRLGAAKQRALLGVLLLHANETVSMARLVDELWGERPPATAEKLVHGYVHALRKQLGGGVVETQAPGYRLLVDPRSLDLAEFERLTQEARAAGPEQAAELHSRALALWRGPPLADVVLEGPDRHLVARLAEIRLSTQVDRIDAELATGRHAEVVGELEALVAQHPYQERAAALLMLALYRSGRQADALEVYRTVRGRLSDELGLEPGKELRDLEAAILRQDEALSAPPLAPAADPGQPSTRRFSRRAVIAAGLGGLAAVGLGLGVTAFRSRASGAKLIRAGSVGVVDQITRELVREIPVDFSSPLIAADEDAVWLLDANGSTLTKVDPDEYVVVWTRGIQAGGKPTALAAGEGSVWIALNEGLVLSVLEVEPGVGDVRSRYPLDSGDHVRSESLEAVELTVGGGAVWALERGVGQVTRIDPATDDDEPFAEGLGASSSIAVEGAVWLGGIAGVTKLDLRDGRELDNEFVAPVVESTNTSIAVGRDAVWFVGDSDARLWRIDPLTVSSLDPVPLGMGRPSAVAVADDEAVWVAGGSASSLWRVDPETNEPDTIEVGSTSGGLVAAFGGIWTSPGASAE